MPNWCTNIIKVSDGSEREMDALYALLAGVENPFSIILPVPHDQKGNEYDWCIANWGTKWDAEDFHISREGEGIWMNFSTAWSPSVEVTKRMSEMFPTLQFRHFYEEAGMAFEGIAACHSGQIEDDCRDMPQFENVDEHEEYLNTPLDERLGGNNE